MYVAAYAFNTNNPTIKARGGKWPIGAYVVFLFAPVATPLIVGSAIGWAMYELFIKKKHPNQRSSPPRVEVEFPDALCVECKQPIPPGVIIGALNLKFDKRECLQAFNNRTYKSGLQEKPKP